MQADRSEVGQALATLRLGFLGQLPVRLAAIEQCWIDCHMDPDPAPALRELLRMAHSLHGTAKTYDLPKLGAAAANLEIALQPWLTIPERPTTTDRLRLDGLVAELAAAARTDDPLLLAQQQVTEPVLEISARALLFLLEGDRGSAQHLAAQLEHFGYCVRTFTSPEALHAAMLQERPNVAVLDCDAGHDHAGIELGMRLQELDAVLPVIFVSACDDIETRLRAVQAGGAAFLAKPFDCGKLIETLDSVTGRIATTPYRILVVEDDASLARYYRTLLQDAGMQALAVSQPSHRVPVCRK